jgi:hypothetical protein
MDQDLGSSAYESNSRAKGLKPDPSARGHPGERSKPGKNPRWLEAASQKPDNPGGRTVAAKHLEPCPRGNDAFPIWQPARRS